LSAIMTIHFEQHDSRRPAEEAVVDEGLDASNSGAEPLRDVRPMSVFAREASGRVIGGAVGRSWGACCELQQLWVAQTQRSRGLGRQLMQRFEQQAAQRGCSLVYLDTFSFQAPHFYAALGYQVVLETCGYTQGVSKFTLHKVIAGG
jgi:GNAT superfamily N-acetyltransferase